MIAASVERDQMESTRAFFGEVSDLQTLLWARAYLYRLFHLCFGGRPTAELLETVYAPETHEALQALAGDGDNELKKLDGYLRATAGRGRDGIALDKIDSEYTRLFVGPEEPVVPLWESFYVSDEPALFQGSTLEVRRIYAAQGLRCRCYPKVADDHVSIEAHFQAVMAERACRLFAESSWGACGRVLLEQQRFLVLHLRAWMPAFSDGIRRAPSMLLYPQLMQAFASLTQVDVVLTAEAYEWMQERTCAFDGARALNPSASALRAACERLNGIRLFGLDHNELHPLNAKDVNDHE